MEAPSRNVGLKIIIDFVFLATPALIGILLTIFVDPFERGFFCNDESLSFPFKENTISTTVHALMFSLSAFFIIIVVEIIRAKTCVDPRDKTKVKLFNKSVPMVIQNLYRYLGILLFVMSVNQFFTDLAKHSVGRLRPHFFDVCMPQMLDGSTCADEKNLHKYIENYICTNSDEIIKWHLKNMRLSFPSGHSSSGFAVTTYVGIYIHSRITWRGSNLLKHILQVIYIAAAAFVGFTRISDYAHHWSDVVGSALFGIVIGIIAGIFVANLSKSKRTVNNYLTA